MKSLVLFFLVILTVTARSQEKESFFVFNEDWKPTVIDSAQFLLRVHQINDSCWQWDYYNFKGPLVKSERYRDHDGNELNGASNHYNEKGWMDSASMFRRGKKNGEFWKLSGDSFNVKIKYVYKDDSLVEVIDVSKQKKDSSGVTVVEKESEYPGGAGAWMRYMNKNLKYPQRAMNVDLDGEVRVGFIVDKEGRTSEPYIVKSVEYSLDEESMRIIRESGKWEPAVLNGKIVKSYKIQPIIFRLK